MTDRLRVVYLDHCAQLSGAELALLRLLPALAEAVDAHVLLAEEGPLVAKLEAAGVSVEVLPMAEIARGLSRHRVQPGRLPGASVYHTARYIALLVRRLRQLRPDLVHTNSLKAGVYGSIAGSLAGVPVVWHAHDSLETEYLPPAAIRMVRAMVRHLPARVIANSQSTRDRLGAPGVPTAVVPPPVHIQAVSRSRPAGSPLRIGMVGRLAPWKGQHLFLEAFARAFPNGTEQAVVVGAPLFGETDYEQALRDHVVKLGLSERVELTGFRDDVGAELEKLDVLVHASLITEAFGQVVVEGMAAGLAVVAAGGGGPAEVITHDHNGLLYATGDVQALADTLQRVATDSGLRERLGKAARRRARDFTPEVVADNVAKVYRATARR